MLTLANCHWTPFGPPSTLPSLQLRRNSNSPTNSPPYRKKRVKQDRENGVPCTNWSWCWMRLKKWDAALRKWIGAASVEEFEGSNTEHILRPLTIDTLRSKGPGNIAELRPTSASSNMPKSPNQALPAWIIHPFIGALIKSHDDTTVARWQSRLAGFSKVRCQLSHVVLRDLVIVPLSTRHLG